MNRAKNGLLKICFVFLAAMFFCEQSEAQNPPLPGSTVNSESDAVVAEPMAEPEPVVVKPEPAVTPIPESMAKPEPNATPEPLVTSESVAPEPVAISQPAVKPKSKKNKKIVRKKIKKIEKSSEWNFRASLQWLNYVSAGNVSESSMNLDNHIFKVSSSGATTDLRGDFQARYSSWAKFILRPQLLYSRQEIRFPDTGDWERPTTSTARWTEAYSEIGIGDHISVAVGLQNYQWGPAELASPSNPIFHFNTSQRSLFYLENGRMISRLNLSMGQSWSAILLQEFLDNQTPFWAANRSFEKTSLAKLEYRSAENSNRYLGLVYGQEQGHILFSGLYANVPFLETFSTYVDARRTQGSIAYYPTEISPGVDTLASDPALEKVQQTYAIFGFRHEGDWDIRLEGLYNSAGYDDKQLKRAVKASSAPNPMQLYNVSLFSANGLELPGQRYVYSSLRIPNLGKKKDGTVMFHYFYSLQDYSNSLQVSLEKSLNSMLVFSGEGTYNFGSQDTEMNLLAKSSCSIGLKAYW